MSIYTLPYHIYFYLFICSFFLAIILMLAALEHFLVLIIFLDLLLLCNILLLILYTVVFMNAIGYVYALLLLGVAATDTALGIGLFILYFKSTGQVSLLQK